MRSIEQQIKENEKFLQKEVDRLFDDIINPELTWQDRTSANRCIFCSGRKINDLVFDIIAKCYETEFGEVPTRAEEIRKCNHMYWTIGTTVEIASFLTDAIQEGFPELWMINGDMTKVLPFGPIHAITALANFDFAEFMFTKWADKAKSLSLAQFQTYYNNNIRTNGYRVENNQNQTECDPIILEEIKKIEEQFFWIPAKNNKGLGPDEKDAIINHFGKTLLPRFERIDAEVLINIWQDVEYVHLRRDWIMLYLKKIGKEWIESLQFRTYNFYGFERTNEKLKFYQRCSVDPKIQENWIKTINELLTWKENTEIKFGRKLLFDIWQRQDNILE